MICSPPTLARTGLYAAVLALTFAGCGNSSGLVPAGGRVLYKGQPAIGARLHFHRQDAAADATKGEIPSAVVDEEGRFELSTGDLGRGAPAGRYVVLVSWPLGEGGTAPAVSPKGRRRGRAVDLAPTDRLKGRYLDISKPLITAQVDPTSGELSPIELKD